MGGQRGPGSHREIHGHFERSRSDPHDHWIHRTVEHGSGYLPTDVNLDGVTKYTGSGNDRDRVILTIGGNTPNNTRTEQLP